METRLQEERVQLRGEIGCPRARQAANDNLGARRERGDTVADKMPQLPDHAMALHGIAHNLADNKTRSGWQALRAGHVMQNKMR